MNFRIGFGYDVHRLETGETLWIGGIEFNHEKGTVAHSDGDVLIHAICDALLGSLSLRDIGYHFPDTSSEFKNADSKDLLRQCVKMVRDKGFEISNIDSTICAERPKFKDHINRMQQKLAEILTINNDQVSVKATTNEKLGFVGSEEGISSYASVLVYKV